MEIEPHVSQPQESLPDVQLRRALVAFLSDARVDWRVLARDLEVLASTNPTRSPQTDRQAWLLLADYLAHADRGAGVPPEVRRLLESDESARAAEAAFREAMSLRGAWLHFVRNIERERTDR